MQFQHLKRKKKFLGNSVIDLPPMGLLYMAATLIKGGHEVAVLDTPTLQLNISETLEEINRFQPDLVGVSIYSGFRNNMYVLTQELRKVFDGPILAGGHSLQFMFNDEKSSAGAALKEAKIIE